MKKLIELANNPDHCRLVWECVTGYEVPDDFNVRHEIFSELIRLEGTTGRDTYVRVWIYKTGDVEWTEDGGSHAINVIKVAALLQRLGYGIE